MFHRNTIRIACTLFVMLLLAGSTLAQSIDPGAPTPIRGSSLQGHIAARDLGDSRLTDHYYTFKGTPGDLLITVQASNLNGDLDVFTAVTLRPLLKLSLYAENTNPVTKGIYLRRNEDLILRIEARSPNDDEGTYRLYFGGSFQPIMGGQDIAENEPEPGDTPSVADTGGRKTKRVSSVGARLPEPEPAVPEVAALPSPTPEATPVAAPTEETTKAESREAVSESTPSRNTPRSRRPTTRRPTTRPVEPKESETTVAEIPKENEKPKEEAEKPSESETPKPSRPAPRSRRGSASTARSKRTETVVEPEPAPEIGPRLIIETLDGRLINRSMSTVRRVMVENGQVVVTGKDGKIERIPLANVARMSIAP